MNVGDRDRSVARAVSLVASAWLFISAFIWPHTAAQRVNAALVGLVALLTALYSLGVDPRARYVNTALAVWLFLSAFVLPRASGGTTLSNVLVAVVLFAASLIRSDPPRPLNSGV